MEYQFGTTLQILDRFAVGRGPDCAEVQRRRVNLKIGLFSFSFNGSLKVDFRDSQLSSDVEAWYWCGVARTFGLWGTY